MVERVIASDAALALIARLKAEHGDDLIFFQSGGCCDGSSPMCYLPGELTPGPHDRQIGSVGGCAFFMRDSQYALWQHTQLIVDVVPGSSGTFSLEGPYQLSFIARARVFTDAEQTQLAHVNAATALPTSSSDAATTLSASAAQCTARVCE